MLPRQLDLAIISDVHLGTYGCHADELLDYLKSIRPRKLIINGDFIDGWAFSKSYFPDAHFEVIRYVLKMIRKGCKVIYITGNHDEFLRNYSDLTIGGLSIVDKYIMEIEGRKYWFFHGDIFDHSTKGISKYLAKVGGKGYDGLIIFNRLMNNVLVRLGREKYSLSKKIKSVVKHAVKFIHDFEANAAEAAIAKGFDVVICGHIHQPRMQYYRTSEGAVQYLNSGDWIENLSALEYCEGSWSLFHYPNKFTSIQNKAAKKMTEELVFEVH
ncbi:MAG: UDP-2,3-diacylglucosamine diphosphatase [Saprospiraceae bacterium]